MKREPEPWTGRVYALGPNHVKLQIGHDCFLLMDRVVPLSAAQALFEALRQHLEPKS